MKPFQIEVQNRMDTNNQAPTTKLFKKKENKIHFLTGELIS